MSSASEPPVSLAVVARILRETGVDESHASAVYEAVVRVAAGETPSRDAPTTAAGTRPRASSSRREVGAVETTVFAQQGAIEPGAAGAEVRVSFPPTGRLVGREQLGQGGMGEVHRVYDAAFRRYLAMKVMLAGRRSYAARELFIEEAQVTAQLAHPGIPPVHELGTLEDGRPYFTMKEVHGVTLADVVAEAHGGGDEAGRWSEQRLLEIFQKVCEAVAYAHARGVVHCDLKPENVMVGTFGEVLVMDWGVARLVAPSRSIPTDEPRVTVDTPADVGSIIAGTPSYMPPEQSSGRTAEIGPATDVYALGVMLFELLTGARPYSGSPRELLEKASAGEIPPIPRRAGSAVDDALRAIVARAMAPSPRDRYPDAKAMAEDLALWREGAMRRERALAQVRQARATLPEIEPRLAVAEDLRDRARRELARLGPAAPVESKARAWALLDEAGAISRDALLRQVEAEQLLFNALAQAPDLAEAKSLIAQMRRSRHADAERRRAWDEAATHELVMRANDTGELREYLDGSAPLTVVTRPGATFRVHRMTRAARRLVPEWVRDVDGPIVDARFPIGSYLIEIVAPGCAPVLYPVLVRRQVGWSGRRPGDAAPFLVPLPDEAAIAANERLVAAGCSELGGDERAPGAHRSHHVWVDGFVMRADPVTFGELAAFLVEPEGIPFQREVLRDGLEVWRADWPAVGISWNGAAAYAAWLARKTGLPWRLPTEIEWEKAARGVDGRFYPWGDLADPAFLHCRTVEHSPTTPAPVGAHRTDVSPYGVRGMGGNVRDWCADAAGAEAYVVGDSIALPADPAPGATARVVRGGSWRQPPEAARVAGRASLPAGIGHPDVGFRLVRSV